MKLEGTLKPNNILEIEYDEEAKDAIIKAYCLLCITNAEQVQKIARLQQRVKHWRRKYFKCKKSK